MSPRSIGRLQALTLALLALLGCSPRRAPPAAETSAGGPPVVAVSVPEIRALVARTDGRATLVNVWATWCAPCRQEFPALLSAARASGKDLRLVLISADFDDQLPAVKRFLAEQGVTDTTYLKTGADMEFINALDSRWSGALPATFAYDAGGRQTSFWEGAGDEARFRSAVQQALTPHSTDEGRRP